MWRSSVRFDLYFAGSERWYDHRFNNVLVGITGNVELITESFAPGSREYPLLCTALESTESMAELTQQLLAFVGKKLFVLVGPLDVSEVIRGFESALRARVPQDINIGFELSGGLPRVEADPAELQHAVQALVANALHAMGRDGGTIAVRTRSYVLGRDELDRLPNGINLKPGEYVGIEVSETGGGIPPEHRDRIFEPFFSTGGCGFYSNLVTPGVNTG